MRKGYEGSKSLGINVSTPSFQCWRESRSLSFFSNFLTSALPSFRVFVRLFFYSALLLCCAVSSPAFADTNVSGVISSDTTWTAASSPYVITGNILVNSGITLTIEPGVTVKYDSGKSLQVNGTLIARGTSGSKIIFTSNSSAPAAGDWGNIYFTDTSTDATYDGNGDYTGGSILECCIVEYGGSSDGELKIEDSAPFVNNSTFQHSLTNGIWLKQKASSKIMNNTIKNNGSNGIYFFEYGSGGGGGPIIVANNDIKDNQSGWGLYFSATLKPSQISNNKITNNGNGMGFATDGTITLTENIVTSNLGRSLYARGSCTFTITKNIFLNNSQGLYISYSTFTFTNNIIADNSSSAIYINQSGSYAITNNQILRNTAANGSVLSTDFYNSGSGTIQYNLFADNNSTGAGSYSFIIEPNFSVSLGNNNIFRNTSTYELYNSKSSGSANLDAKNNYWGTTVDSEIQAKIYDWYDNSSKGIVDYTPFLNTPDTTAPISPPTNVQATPSGNNVTLTWNANPESDKAGYKVYWDTKSGYPYGHVIDVGNATTYTLNNVTEGTYIAVTAYDSTYNAANDDAATIVNENQTNGNESWFSTEIIADAVAPASPTVSINSGVTYTTSRNVTLSLSATDGVGITAYYTSETSTDPLSGSAGWVSVTSSKNYSGNVSFTIGSAGDGEKRVYVWFKDANGNVSQSANDTIILDTTAPVITSATSSTSNGSYIEGNMINITLNFSEAVTSTGLTINFNSGGSITTGALSNASSYSGSYIVGAGQNSTDLSVSSVIGTMTDSLGNTATNPSISAGQNIADTKAIVIDTTGPTGSISINGGVANTNSTTVALALAANDVAGITQMKFSNDGTNWSDQEAYTTLKSWSLTSDDGEKHVYVKFKDTLGNWSSTYSDAIILDTSGPSGTIVINGGAVNTNSTAVTLTLNATDTNSVTQMQFSNDNMNWSDAETYAASKAWALTSGDGIKAAYVRFKDSLGNWSSAYIDSIVLDTTKPTAGITSPADGKIDSTLYTISGTASDVESGVSKVELQITDGTNYVASDLVSYITTSTWLNATGTDSWTFNTSSVKWEDNIAYTIKARSTDAAGNISDIASVTFTKVPNYAFYSTLSLDLSTQTMLQNSMLTATGKLTRLPDAGLNLAGHTIKLIITNPDGSSSTQSTTTYDALGHYKFENISGFAVKGAYKIKASFDGTAFLTSSSSDTKTVLVGTSAGYAVIVEGKLPPNSQGQSEGIDSHNKTANRIYKTLKQRGFDDANIYYLNYTTSQEGITVDASPTKTAIQAAIEGGGTFNLIEKLNNSAAPLYIIMVDHGNPNTFYINNETITPSDLNSWLTTLESGLNSTAKLEKRIIINGSCYSGSFIPTLSKSGRVIITSAAADEESYKGPNEPDGVRSGEYFLEEFFKELGKGQTLKASFEEATKKTTVYTNKGANSANSNGRHNDNAMQHPMLDDDGDGKGSNVLTDDDDGKTAKDLFMGAGVSYDTNAANNPADITAVTDTVHLTPSETTTSLWATANYDNEVSSAWLEVRKPSKTLSARGGSNQLEVDIPKELMQLSGGKWTPINSITFDESGKYEIYYFAKDKETLEISQMKRSIVYKNKTGNNPPNAFGLTTPANEATQKTIMILDWEDTTDPDGDQFTYTVLISKNSDFSTIAYKKEEIKNSLTYIGADAKLSDLTTYYWKVLAIDSYGAKRESSTIRSFKTDNTNGLPGIISGYIADAETGMSLTKATITSDTAGEGNFFPDGYYFISVPTGSTTLKITSDGYKSKSLELDISPGDEISKNIKMAPLSTIIDTGDGVAPDITPPVTTVAPAGGTYPSTKTVSVELTCDDGADVSGCAATYYSVDSSDPATAYSGPITISSDTTLKFYSVDKTGNKETVNEETYLIVTLNANQFSLTVGKETAGDGTGTVQSLTKGQADNNIDCDESCEESGWVYEKNATITLKATPSADSYFSGWTGCTGKAATCTIKMNGNKSVTAKFEQKPVLTVAKAGDGDGKVTATGLVCSGDTCTGTYVKKGTAVKLTVKPDSASRFKGWSGDACSGSTAFTCSVTMSGSKDITATFDPIPTYTVTVTKTGSGKGTVTGTPKGVSNKAITCGSTCSASYLYGTKAISVTLTAVPDKASKSKFVGWSGGVCSGTKTTCKFNVDANKDITAIFGQPDIAVSATSVELGTVAKGQTGTPQTFVINNVGDVELKITAMTLTGTGAKMFKVLNNDTGKAIKPMTINAGGSVTVKVTFAPTTNGLKTANLTIKSDDPDKGSGVAVALTGTGSGFAKVIRASDGADEGLEFNPEGLVTREEMAEIITAAISYQHSALSKDETALSRRLSAFSSQLPDNYVTWREVQEITGVIYDMDNPDDYVTREAMAFIAVSYQLSAISEELSDDYCDTGSPFADVSPDRWSCKYIKKLDEMKKLYRQSIE